MNGSQLAADIVQLISSISIKLSMKDLTNLAHGVTDRGGIPTLLRMPTTHVLVLSLIILCIGAGVKIGHFEGDKLRVYYKTC